MIMVVRLFLFINLFKNDKLDEFNNNVYRLLNKDGIIDYKCIADYNVGSKLYNILNRKDF